MTRAVFQESLSEPRHKHKCHGTSYFLQRYFHEERFTCGGYIHQNIPLNLVHASTRRLRLPWQQNAGVCQVAPVTGGALGGDLGCIFLT